ncbi:MAG: tRNA (N(6)-L-threonylcarbamoyladenosine(37)-C(2))-methylthiotransferase [Candidatus Heimdallarchaeota archaeon]|nr:MAG: tRNA (N(6)-L-threonylcarbamoyladenosine(37)-C(2))-methylthiotransferase [Candidatus Heimdallarchaeota archaeon]
MSNLDRTAMKSIEESKNPIHVLNYGCSANRAIAEGLTGILQRHGYTLTNFAEDAKVIIVNTCVVKQNTEHRMKSKLLSLSQAKEIIITGCLPVVMRDWVSENLPHAKILFPEVANQITELLKNQSVLETKTTPPHDWSQMYKEDRFRYNPIITTIEISRGCLGNCTFCIVRNIKGSVRSRSQESILAEVGSAIERGSREIWLTSQDTGVYGWDLSPKLYIPTLIDSIARSKGEFFIRLGMMTPITLKRFFKPLVRQIRNPKVFSFLHLPIQSGSNSILQKMRRKETQQYFIDLVSQLRQEIDELVLATDIIVGFPGESKEDFKATKDLIREINPVIVNISKYTDRPQTLASKLPDKIPTKVKANRSRELTRLTREITQRELKKWIGWKGIMLIDEIGKLANQYIGRNTSYLPIVIEDGDLSLGQFLTVFVTDTGPTYLIGEREKGT